MDTPPTSELFTKSQFAQRHPHLFDENRLAWATRPDNRCRNGLDKINAVYPTKGGELLIHEPKFIAWWLGLTGRAKPRAQHHRRRASAA